MNDSVWFKLPFGKLAANSPNSIVGGPFGSNLVSSDYTESGVPVIRGQNMGSGRWVSGNFAFVSEEKAESLRANLARPGDVVFTQRGTLGQVALVPDAPWNHYVVSQSQMKATVNRDLADPIFIYYYFTNPVEQQYIAINAIQTGVPHSNLGQLRAHPMCIPSVTEQRTIAGVLSALDDKIEQNRHIAQKLEQLARTIFCAWFVNFEPIKAKAAGATCFPSTPQRTFDALPTDFVDSDIGPVPKGWKVQPLASVATFLNGLALQKYPPRGDVDDLPVIKIAQLRKGSTEGSDLANGDVPAEYVVADGDLLFSWSGTLEAAFWFGGNGALNQHLFKVISDKHPNWLCLMWIQQHLPWFRAIAAGKATTMGHIKRGHLTEVKVVTATPQVLQAANDVIGPLYDLYAQTMLESRKLAEMRDYLLPKLLSGDVCVRSIGSST